jgi:hypothetical protein
MDADIRTADFKALTDGLGNAAGEFLVTPGEIPDPNALGFSTGRPFRTGNRIDRIFDVRELV